jgi:hypothetical protein
MRTIPLCQRLLGRARYPGILDIRTKAKVRLLLLLLILLFRLRLALIRSVRPDLISLRIRRASPGKDRRKANT